MSRVDAVTSAVTLTVHSAGGYREFEMEGGRLLVGRAGASDGRGRAALLVEDDGLEPLHASINREGASLWVLDEGSPAGTFVNGRRVPPQGSPLADGDRIFAGHHTTIVVRLRPAQTIHEDPAFGDEDEPLAPHTSSPRSQTSSPRAVVVAVVALCLIALAVAAFALVGSRGPEPSRERAQDSAPPAVTNPPPTDRAAADNTKVAAPTPAETSDGQRDTTSVDNTTGAAAGDTPTGAKLYLRMSDEERLRFLEGRARHISVMMGNRPYAFNDEVLRYIKQYVDVYARRVGNNSQRMWGEDLRFVFARARTRYAPHIIRAFNARGVPPVVGLYIVMIETEYHNIRSENFAGAAGLFQFIGPTARLYGVEPSERTDVEKMAPAAARYMSDRIAEFGPDSMSVALAIAGYNRSPDSVRRDLRDVLDSGNRERSFWTLVANSDKLDHYFQNENIKYVPKFFAAAIVGENPEAFGLEMRKLSTYTTPETLSENPAGGVND